MGAGPALVRGDQVGLGDQQLDRVLEVGDRVEEVVHRLALASAAAQLAVVDEVDAEQSLTGRGVALDDRFAVEPPRQLPVLRLPDLGIIATAARGRFTAMGCLLVLFAFISPRLALFVMFLFTDLLSHAFDSWIIPFLGFFLLPWTTLAYAAMWSLGTDQVSGFEWFIVILAFVVDIGSYASRDKARRHA